VRLLLALDSGRRLEIAQDLDEPTRSRVFDVATGRDHSGEYVFGGAIDGSRILGLNRDIFAATISVRQAELLRVSEEAHGLQEQLQRAAQASAADATAEAALDRLRAYRTEHVGAGRPGTSKPLARADEESRQASRALEMARAEQGRFMALRTELEAALRDEARWARAYARARGDRARRERADLAERVTEIQPLAERFATGPPASTEPLGEEAQRISALIAEWRAHPQLGPLAGPMADELARELAAVPPPPQGDLEVAPEVEVARDRWRRAADALDLHLRGQPAELEGGPGIDARPAELRALAETLARPLPTVDPNLEPSLRELDARLERAGRATRWIGAVGAAGVVAALLLALGGQPVGSLAAAALGFAGVAVALSRSRSGARGVRERAETWARHRGERDRRAEAEQARAAAARRLAELGLPVDVDAVWQAAASIDEAESRRERVGEWRRAEVSLQEVRAREEARLRRALVERGVLEANDAPARRLSDLFEGYADACRRNREQARAAARRVDLEARLAARREEERRHAEASAAREAAGSRLLAAAAALALGRHDTPAPGGDPALRFAVGALEARLRAIGQERSALDEAHRDYNRLAGLLGPASLSQLVERLAEMENELGPYDAAMTPSLTVSELERVVAAAETELERARAAARRLEGEVKQRTETLPSLAEAEERHAGARLALERVESLDRVLEYTIAVLESAKDEVQREIAPRLRAAIVGHLPQVTAARYVDLRIDPADLEVQVQEPGGEWRSALDLSRGTAEQIYLLLRMALAANLVTTGETAPLLLDDVTVQSDTERARAILELLHRESARRQVILFSQQDEVLAWARDRLRAPQDRVIELAGPARVRALEGL
jgi:hypothetical protein